ncbi:hypothetical protein RFI_19647 [Reticulomyxa filosa]|uniref:Uncharacterized protein n=1 Tax=Reticulomyxa filosa TaxID=46433 RepID=X6MV00_RETFI|nr:hypothetical protein RFI_19647 [Reticulomyxa filosa]|eukprot:ETO17674.1 hypothetical protein RFI_19647 [Reticulomyxa filosa]
MSAFEIVKKEAASAEAESTDNNEFDISHIFHWAEGLQENLERLTLETQQQKQILEQNQKWLKENAEEEQKDNKKSQSKTEIVKKQQEEQTSRECSQINDRTLNVSHSQEKASSTFLTLQSQSLSVSPREKKTVKNEKEKQSKIIIGFEPLTCKSEHERIHKHGDSHKMLQNSSQNNIEAIDKVGVSNDNKLDTRASPNVKSQNNPSICTYTIIFFSFIIYIFFLIKKKKTNKTEKNLGNRHSTYT